MTFKPRLAKDIAASATEAIDWLVHGLLPLGILALLAAYPKVGKSTLATHLAVAVAQGHPFLGRPTRQGGVLYVVAEERKDDVIRRLRDFGWTEADPIWLWEEQVADSLDDRKKMSGFITQNKIALVIIDTWASYLMVQDETNNSQVTIKMKPYVDMAHESGATILFIHHERKGRDEGGDDSRAIRGGGAILALVGLALQLQRDGTSTGRKLKTFGRWSEIPKELKLAYEEEGYVSLGTPDEASLKAVREKVVALLPMEGQGLTVKEVAGVAKLKEGATRKALDDAYAAKIAERTGSGKKNDPYRYRRVAVTQECEATMELVPVGAGDKEVAEV